MDDTTSDASGTTDMESPDTVVDVVVIGGGPAGENVAGVARDHDLEVVLVERELLGGECSYWGCMPSKALLRPGEVLAAARGVPGAAGAIVGGVDVAATFRSRDAMAAHWDDAGQAAWVEGTGTTLVRGLGRLAGERLVAVDHDDGSTTTIRARRGVVLATGSRAAMPPIDGLADARPWDNRDITTATAVPDRLLVLGGGAIGVEMGQAFAELGATVTIIEMADRLLPAEEPFASELVRTALEDLGIQVRVGARARAVRRNGDTGPVVVETDDGDELVGDELLVATGRRPTTAGLGLEVVGLDPDRFVDVDDQLRATGVDGGWLYAVGDVNGRALLTHHGKYQARLVGAHLAGVEDAAVADHDALVRVVFTHPQVAAVGRTEALARQEGLEVFTLRHDLGATAGGSIHGRHTVGAVQLVVAEATRTIVGATFAGPGVGEMLHAATIAVVAGVTLDQLWHAVPAFPTMSEVWLRLLEADRARGRERDG